MPTKKRNPHPLSVARLLLIEYQICKTLAEAGGRLSRRVLGESLGRILPAHIDQGLSSLAKKEMVREVTPGCWGLTLEGFRFLGDRLPCGVTCA